MRTFVDLLRQRRQNDGDQVFLLFDDAERTWAQTVGIVARLARLLEHRGVEPGARVLLACENSPTFLYGWFALRWLGATCVPLHTGATDASIAAMVSNADIRVVLGDAALVGRVVRACPEVGERTLVFTDFHELESTVAHLDEAEPRAAHPADECSILYTSGTTGVPKGVVLSEQSFVSGGSLLASSIGIDGNDRILVALPLFHTNPQVYAVSVALTTGCSLVVLPEFKPAELIAQAARYGATGFTYVGTLLHLVLAKTSGDPRTTLRFCAGGGASPDVWRRVEERFGVTVHELYGMTEVGGWVTVTEAASARIGFCGRARPDVDLAIVDEDDNLLDAEKVGQIVVRPREPSVIFDGYNGRPELTLSKYRNLWFHTGDLGSLTSDGYLRFLGRTDDVIRRGGENVAPSDIEAVVRDHPAVAEVAVVGVADDVMGQEVKVVLVMRPGHRVDAEEIFNMLADRLPRFARPRYLELRDSLPRTATHKVRLNELRNIDGSTVFDRRRPNTITAM